MIDEKNKDTQNTTSTGSFGSNDKTGGTSPTGGASASGGGTGETGNSGAESLSLDSAKETAKETARGLIDTAKSTAGQAYGVATEKATTVIDEKKGDLASGLTTVADTIRQVGSTLREADEQTGITDTAAQYGDSLAQQIEKISQYFERNDVRVMMRDVETFARRNPAAFIGGAFAVGLLAARFLKSSNPNPNAPRRLSDGRVSNDHLLRARNDAPIVQDFRKPAGTSITGTGNVGGKTSDQKSTENKPGNQSGTGGNTVTNPS